MKLKSNQLNSLVSFFQTNGFGKGKRIKKQNILKFILDGFVNLLNSSKPKGVAKLKKLLRSMAPDVFEGVGNDSSLEEADKDAIAIFVSRIMSRSQLKEFERRTGVLVVGEGYTAAVQANKEIPTGILTGSSFYPGTEKVMPRAASLRA